MKPTISLSLILAALAVSGCSTRGTVTAAKELTPVRPWVVRQAAATTELRYAGSIEPSAQVTLAFRVPGVVESVHQVRGAGGRLRTIETGDCVPAGATLARVRTTEFRARTDSAQAQWSDAQASRATVTAQMAEAQAALTQAGLDWSRAEKLLAGQAMTRAEADAVKARLEAAQARVDAARSQVRSVDAKMEAASAVVAESRVGLGDTVVTAPFPACVVSRHVERGAFAQPGLPAFTIADLTRVKVVFHVPDTELTRFRPGTVVQVGVETMGGSTLEAAVQSVSPAADPVARSFRVEAVAANPGRRLSAGLIASVRLPSSPPASPQEMTVPLSAIMRGNNDGTEFAVFVIEGQKVSRRAVRLGTTRGNEVVVVSGLTPNQKVVREGVAKLNDGETVRVME